MSIMTAEQEASVKSTKTRAAYDAAVDKVKEEHGGDYPDDWYAKMIVTDEVARIGAQFGEDGRVHVLTLDGDSIL